MEICSFEIAKKLKEKGFNEQCLAYYTKDSNFYYNKSYGSDVENAFKSFNSRPNHICGKRIDAPTISQVLKWLREKKEIDIIIDLIITYNYNLERIREYSCRIYTSKLNKPKTTDCFKSFEQAAIDGIKYVIDNLI